MAEQWKDIPGYEGIYQISSSGVVRSLNRICFQKSSHGTVMTKRYEGKEIKPFDNGHGYSVVLLAKPGEKRKQKYIHRLVAEAFIPNPAHRKEVNHIDYNKKNNNVNNLEWVSRSENVHYSVKNMEKQKKKAKETSTGQRYITRKKGMFRLNIQRKSIKVDRRFKTLDEAIQAREVIIGGKEHYAG